MSLIFDKILQYHYYPRHKKTEPSTYCELSQRYQKKFRGELKMFRGTISPQQAACPRPPRVRPTLSSACRAPRPLRPLLLPRHDAGDPASRGHRLPAPDALLPPLPPPHLPPASLEEDRNLAGSVRTHGLPHCTKPFITFLGFCYFCKK